MRGEWLAEYLGKQINGLSKPFDLAGGTFPLSRTYREAVRVSPSLSTVECPRSIHHSFQARFCWRLASEHVYDLKRSPNTPFHVTAPLCRSLPLAPSSVGGSLESENGLAFSGAQPSDQSRPLCCFNNILACTKWMAGRPFPSAGEWYAAQRMGDPSDACNTGFVL